MTVKLRLEELVIWHRHERRKLMTQVLSPQELVKAYEDSDPKQRIVFLKAFQKAQPTSFLLANETLVNHFIKTAVLESDSLSQLALNTVALVTEKRSNLVRPALCSALSFAKQDEWYTCKKSYEVMGAISKKSANLVDLDVLKAIALASASGDDWNVRNEARQTLGTILEKRPDYAQEALAIVEPALVGSYYAREAACETIGVIIDKCPGQADVALIEKITRMAISDPARSVRYAARATLGTIIEKCPGLTPYAVDIAESEASNGNWFFRKKAQKVLDVVKPREEIAIRSLPKATQTLIALVS